YPALMVQEALAGQLPGFFLLQNDGNPGEDNFNAFVRGSVGGYITLVDGIERPLNPYDLEQIEEVRLLKDPVSKALYGARVSNGIIMVTTRRGKSLLKSEFHASVQKGVKMPTVLPKYLNAYDFATNYNKALANDNITTGVYNQATLDDYQNKTNPYVNPDVDFYDQFLNKSMELTRVSTEYYGGNASTKFYVHGGYQKEGGLEKYAAKPRQVQAFNLQGNIDSKFSDAITLHANFAGYMANKQYPGDLGGVILNTLSTRYPNAYPIFVARDSAGGTASFKDNPFAQQAQRGYTQENHLRMQTDLGFDFNLDKVVKGLTFKPAYSFDIYHKQNLQKLNTVGIYSISGFDLNGVPNAFNILQVPTKATSQALADDDYGRRWGFTGILAYKHALGKGVLNTDLVYFISKEVYAGEFQDYKRQNLGLRANYTYNEKYTLEGVLNYVGSQSYTVDNRFKTYPALGAGWIISKEAFLKNSSFVDYLKLNASWGIMGDGNIGVNQWRETWGRPNGNYSFNTSATGATAQLNQVASSMLDWPSQRETDISIEANLLKKIEFKFTYFDYLQSDLLSRKENVTPLILGGSNFLPVSNYGKTGLKGIEAELSYSGKAGKLSYEIGSHFTYSKSKRVLIDELPDPNFITQGTPWDAIRGYQSDGTYTQDDITKILAGTSTLALPSYMDPKALRVGNIKYKDQNGDKILD
ncbi:MAG: TonB-dependent receptor plug domain-containing protein, partial [Ferruginibacter sp.]